ncbi:hypothetical protein [Labedaea rhizosphaerae]|uniref:Uncharacterized protein n=1 Tax=Labedaea rhizosphaerae TaxID=598644 RepID=A0A4R6SGY9_LABRH|nr:hypothetical protein [Labedaea rhizosphaerae]TDQ01292.1 hypothetical protein EV186_1021160 [Labedaea rhizosphaerae]
MIAGLLITALFVALLVIAWRAGVDVGDDQVDGVDRPGNDEQWADLADAMRRYRRHKARGRLRGDHRVL